MTTDKHPVETSKGLIEEALAAVQEDPAAEDALGLLASTLASAQSNLFEAAKYPPDHRVSVRDMRKAMEFLARALQHLQDIDSKSRAVEIASGAVARSLANLYKVVQPTGPSGPPSQELSKGASRRPSQFPVAQKDQVKKHRAPGAAPPPTESDLRCKTMQIQLDSTLDMDSETHFYTGLSGRIDEGGIFVATFDVKPINSKIAVSFNLPLGQTIVTKGLVRWVREYSPENPDQVPGMGVSFIQLRDADRQAIEAFLERKAPILYDDE